MQKVKLTVTTPNPWGDGYDPGDITISPKVSDQGENLLAVLSVPSGKTDAGVSDAVLTPADVQANMFMMGVLPSSASPQLNAGVVLVTNPAISSIVFNSVPESGTNAAFIGILLVLGLVSRRFRRR